MKITSRKQIKNKEKSDESEYFREFTVQLHPGLTENDPEKDKRWFNLLLMVSNHEGYQLLFQFSMFYICFYNFTDSLMWFQIIRLAYLHSTPVVLSPFKRPDPYVETRFVRAMCINAFTTLQIKRNGFLPCVGLKLLNYCYPIMCTSIAVFLYFLLISTKRSFI